MCRFFSIIVFPHIAWKAGQGYHPGDVAFSDKVLPMYPR